jgi:uncharacterized protein (DUF1800 family)
MWRAGFGPAADQLDQLSKLEPSKLYKALQKASSKKPDYINVASNYLNGLVMGVTEAGQMDEMKKQEQEETRRRIRLQNREDVKKLNLVWLDEMVNSNSQLREKMSFFWHGHFASRNLNILYQQQLLDIIRQNALGSFRTLLLETSQSASILNFLNAQQNKKGQPNENFAREVMELFTMGRGNYSENDIKEAARAFTGWTATANGAFYFRKNQHDFGSKTVLGKTGNFSGEEVLDILLEQKQTAKYITQKIYKFFVNDNADNEKVEWLANRFYSSDYDIGKLMDDIFTSSWFYDEKNIGVQIKSPIELLAGIRRMLPMKLENEDSQLLLQRVLGQVLFYPPNVAGWPGGKSWIDSSSLMVRMRIPLMINDEDDLNVRPKADDDIMGGQADEKKPYQKKYANSKANKPIKTQIAWDDYSKNFESVPREQLLGKIQTSLLQVVPAFQNDLIKQFADASGRENFIRTATLQIMSTPEYQLC